MLMVASNRTVRISGRKWKCIVTKKKKKKKTIDHERNSLKTSVSGQDGLIGPACRLCTATIKKQISCMK